mmetsp:Transcript_9520/g.15214  ORF Transcript_9520/g.15214 Transcript_9520/m.15214 type:complete len:89 (+) Transcript_9520:202-468(+)
MIDGKLLYEVTGTTPVVDGSSLAVFIITQAFTVALAATRWYAAPFFALYPIAIYQIVMVPTFIYHHLLALVPKPVMSDCGVISSPNLC